MFLGIKFLSGVSLILDVANRIRKFHAALRAILREKVLGFEHAYVKLLLTNFMLILFYGLDSLIISNNVMLSITKAWNMAFLWIFGLRKFDSTRLLLKNCKIMPAKF